MLRDIKSLGEAGLRALFRDWNQPEYRVAQLLEWLYPRRAVSWKEMSNLPKALREKLAGEFTLQALELVRKQGARDTTQKFLWKLADGAFIESVLIPANPALYGESSDRHTLCISTQVGCAYGCKFCASGLDGFKRNLGIHEIIEQVLSVERWHSKDNPRRSPSAGGTKLVPASASSVDETSCDPPTIGSSLTSEPAEKGRVGQQLSPGSLEIQTGDSAGKTRLLDNLVIMGMGEPLANYENLLHALKFLNAPWGGGIGARKITISTSGLVPQIRKLAEEPLQFRLAVSLHGATDLVRNQIMPVNRKYPLAELAEACEFYRRRHERMISFEYILIAGVNDGLDQIKPLSLLARKLQAKVNLIPYNQVDGLKWERPDDQTCEAFLSALERENVVATLRREKGHDIDAACGQLRLKTEREMTEQKP